MLYNLKIALRNLKANKTYSIINIVGLSVSLTACILISLWIVNELSYDKFYKRSKDIYLVSAKINMNGKDSYWRSTPTAVSYVGREEIPGIEDACAINMNYDLGYLGYEDKNFTGDQYIAVDPTFFNIFDNIFIEGSATNPLPDPYSVVLTESLAKKIFGNEPAFGKQLKGSNGPAFSDETYYVSGVVKDQPKNSYLEYDAVFSFVRSRFNNTWDNWSFRNFFMLQPGTNIKDVTQKLLELQKKNYPNLPAESFALQPLTDIRLHKADGKDAGIASVRLFFFIGMALLFIACINYINLTTARVNKKNKEISVKKIMGANRWKLMLQLMNETFILCSIALIIGLFLAFLVIPGYNQLTGKQFVFRLTDPPIWMICTCILTVVTLLSGLYPATKISSFKPINAFRSQTSSSKVGFSLRKILVVFQFIAVSGFIIITLVLNKQLHFIQNKQLGYDKEQLIQIQSYLNLDMRLHYQSFKSDLEKEACIQGVTGSEQSILWAGFTDQIKWEGMPENTQLNARIWGADRNFLSLLNIPLIEGNYFSGTPGDSSLCFINETAVKQMGIDHPTGKTITIPKNGSNKTYTIAGVVKNFHFEPLRSVIEPLVMHLPELYWTYYIKTQPGKAKEALASAEKIWKKYSPVFPLSYQFVDDAFNEMYRADQQKRDLFNYFSIIAILISCLGLFGLVTYTAETKTKEIGIRKVLGASVGNIVNMLSKEFLILVGISMAIAFPLAYYWLNKLLQDYAYRIEITIGMFIVSALIVIILTILTVGWQAFKAATANPVNSIKNE